MLSDDDVREIRRRHKMSVSTRGVTEQLPSIAYSFGISVRQVQRIAARQARADVPD